MVSQSRRARSARRANQPGPAARQGPGHAAGLRRSLQMVQPRRRSGARRCRKEPRTPRRPHDQRTDRRESPARRPGPARRVLAWLPLILWSISSLAAEVTNDFAAVEAILARSCLDCHAAQDPEAGLVLETFEALMKGGESGAVVVPGKSSESLLVKMVEGNFTK